MNVWKKVLCLVLTVLLIFVMAACGKESDPGASGPSVDTSGTGTSDSDAIDMSKITIDKINLGADYTDLKADLKILTHRTDIVNTVFEDYKARFNKIYPNIKINYEAITDYVEDVTIRMTTKDWGDICMLPTTIDKNQYPEMLVSFGDLETLDKIYTFMDSRSYEGKVYGIPSTGNAQGVVYNKKVFRDAGITELPKTPEEFLDALQKIKDNTDAIPLYSNFAAGWTMTAWDAYIGGCATGDPDFRNRILPHAKDPFADRGDMTGPYAVYYLLYEVAARGLIEDDPTTTDWEGCKGMINRGEIGAMVLGSWAVVQMQEAGPNADDIGYMPFPIIVNGKQYASAGPDYCFAINKHIPDENKLASMIYVKWLTEESNFAYDQGGIPPVKGAEYPSVMDAFDGIELVVDNPAYENEEALFTNLNNESELGIDTDPYPKQRIFEAGLTGSESFDDIMAEWNAKWSAAQEKYGVEVNK